MTPQAVYLKVLRLRHIYAKIAELENMDRPDHLDKKYRRLCSERLRLWHALEEEPWE